MHACKPWLEAEIARIKPSVIIALGLTSATALLGRLVKIAEVRGQIISGLAVAPSLIVSWHPAAILRSADQAESKKREGELIADLKLAYQATNLHDAPAVGASQNETGLPR